jgi:hypothetical protein
MNTKKLQEVRKVIWPVERLKLNKKYSPKQILAGCVTSITSLLSVTSKIVQRG